jgi:hypothetical protein
VPRNSPPEKGDYEPDWTEEELEEKLNALRARGSRRHRRIKAILKPGDLSEEEGLNDKGDFESLDNEGEDLNAKAVSLARTLSDEGEWEELEQLAKCQIIMDPHNLKRWRNIAKTAAKARRSQKPRIVRFLLLTLKIVGGLVVLILAVGIIGAIIGALARH